jgi:hypothetical protein
MGIYILMAFTAVAAAIVGYFMLQDRPHRVKR